MFLGRADRVGLTDLECFAMGFGQGRALGIAPFFGNDQRITLPFLQNRPQFFSRLYAPFDSSRIEQQSDSLTATIPKFFLNLKKRAVDGLAVFVQKLNSSRGLSTRHRRGEVNIEFELVFRQDIAQWDKPQQLWRSDNARFWESIFR